MDDIVERLRWSGQDAMTKHLSLGMWKLHTEAADEIERLRLSARSQKRKKYHAQSARDDHANGLNYWRERALAAESALSSHQRGGES